MTKKCSYLLKSETSQNNPKPAKTNRNQSKSAKTTKKIGKRPKTTQTFKISKIQNFALVFVFQISSPNASI